MFFAKKKEKKDKIFAKKRKKGFCIANLLIFCQFQDSFFRSNFLNWTRTAKQLSADGGGATRNKKIQTARRRRIFLKLVL